MKGEAKFTDDGNSRLMVSRIWDHRAPLAAWLLQNPSRAGAEENDPTLMRTVHFSRKVGAGGVILLNPVPWIATNPADLWSALRRGQVPLAHFRENLDEIERLAAQASFHFVAFGVAMPAKALWHLTRAVDAFLTPERSRPALCLGTSPAGWPLHPLARGKFAIPNSREPQPWKPA